MFTFSFSSAFAVTGSTYTYDQAIAEVQKVVSDAVKAYEGNIATETAKYNVNGTAGTDYILLTVGGENIKISAAAYKTYCAGLVSDYRDDLNESAAVQLNSIDAALQAGKTQFADKTTGGDFNTAAITATPGTYAIASLNGSADATLQKDLLEAEFDVVKADQLADLAKVKTDAYSTKKETGYTETPAEAAERLVAQAISQVTSITVAYTDNAANVVGYIKNAKDVYTASTTVADPTGKLATGGVVAGLVYDADLVKAGYQGLNDLKKADSLATEEAQLEYAKSKVLATLTGQISDAQAAVVGPLENDLFEAKLKNDVATATAKEKAINAAKEKYAKVLEVVTYYVNYQDDPTVLAGFNPTTGAYLNPVLAFGTKSGVEGLYSATYAGAVPTLTTIVATSGTDPLRPYVDYSSTNLEKMANEVAKAKEAAEECKATINIAGDTYTEIDSLLEDAIESIYIDGVVDYSFNKTAVDYLYHYVEGTLVNGAKVRINTVDYKSINNWYNAGDYDKAKQAEAKAAVKAAKAAVRAAKTVEEAQTAFVEGYKAFDAVVTKYDHQKDFTFTTGAYTSAYKAAVEELKAYAGYKNGLYNATGNYKKDAATAYMTSVYTAPTTGKLYTKCFNAEDLTAMVAQAKADIDALKTKAELTAEAEAINKELAALPKLNTVTVADKDAVIAAYEKAVAHNDYWKNIGNATDDIRMGTVTGLVQKIADLEARAIENAYDKIWADKKVTVAEATDVEALRTAVDAFNDFWNNDDYVSFVTKSLVNMADKYDADTEATEDALLVAYVDKLVSEVNALPATGATTAQVKAVMDAYDALGRDGQDMFYHRTAAYSKFIDLQKLAVGNVKELKITASSKATKGAITVTWSVKEGDASAADGYQVWKSTKMNSGFKKAFTTTKTSYKNTKGLKKGTKYYYKVRAYKVVDGKNVYSDWSNKAYRTAK